MSPDQPTKEGSLEEVATLLGLSDTSALAGLGVESLRQRTHRQLLEASRWLGLSGVSKLNKEALAERLWRTLLDRSQDARRPLVEEAGRTVLSHKFDLGAHAEGAREEPRNIPWSYGQDRVTAMAIDPERMYVYWEVTDEAIGKARARLGAGGPGAWLNVRVYDTTGRIFDGTNAHSYFDHKLERHDRQWFFTINKPGSEAFVDVGLLSHEGYFVKIARSGRVDFPRREPVGWAEPEWMTVRAGEGAQHAGRGMPAGAGAAPHGGPGAPGAGFDQVPLWQLRLPWEDVLRFGDGQRAERVEWEVWREEGTETHRRFTWESPTMVSSWKSGPYSYPVEVPGPVTESYEGPLHVYRVDGRTHVVYGPWQVVIRGLGAHFSRQVLARWEVYRTWVAEEGHEVRAVRLVPGEGRAPGSSELMLVGASERRWRGESELRLMGASEVYYVGASERRMMGASETVARGASEWRARGASERRFMGATELRLRGASELALRGASELLFRGASEGRLGGGSEQRLGGASEQRLGASENAYPDVPPSNARRHEGELGSPEAQRGRALEPSQGSQRNR